MPNCRHLKLATAARIVGPDGRVTAVGPRDGVLLAWLALEEPTPRTRLAQLLWPESEPESARNALRQRLFQLKKLLGADVVSGGATLALAEGIAHDLARHPPCSNRSFACEEDVALRAARCRY